MLDESIRRKVASTIGVLSCVAMLAACSGQPETDVIHDPDIPTFSGKYKSEFEQAWVESESEFVRAVISDQEISDEEWAEMGTRLADCLDRKGMTLKGFRDDGSYEVDTGSLSGEDANAALPECEDESGETWVNFLRRSINLNPDNKPVEEIVTECLIRNGVVPEDYTAEDYLEDVQDRSFPYLDPSTGADSFRACSVNPGVELNTQ